MQHYDYEVSILEPFDTIIVDFPPSTHFTPLTPPTTPILRRSSTRKSSKTTPRVRKTITEGWMSNDNSETEEEDLRSVAARRDINSKKERKRGADELEDKSLRTASQRSNPYKNAKSAKEKEAEEPTSTSNGLQTGDKLLVQGHSKLGRSLMTPPKSPPSRKRGRRQAVASKAYVAKTNAAETSTAEIDTAKSNSAEISAANNRNASDQASKEAQYAIREMQLSMITEKPPLDTWYAGVPEQNGQWTICITPPQPTWYHPDWDTARRKEADEKTKAFVKIGEQQILRDKQNLWQGHRDDGTVVSLVTKKSVFWWQCHSYRRTQSWALNVSLHGYDEH
ncbi:uncharacterized protein RSE6_03239 [Rhynchosporium secalis]|uniref:Uncharacterized protein n=1 Tax=Rhynchosporium secalis TaxID=38038 RepID=A0A1E1M2B5_RHYSE|nr:uncharacterized protein RSE6_03239 [Rhynchosporium secalis]